MTMTSRQYVDAKGLKCPVCGSDEVSTDNPEFESGDIHADASCDTCKHSWGEWYCLNCYTGLQTDEGVDVDIPDDFSKELLENAAPALLSALEGMLGAFGYLALTDPAGRWPEIEAAQQALAKAKGL